MGIGLVGGCRLVVAKARHRLGDGDTGVKVPDSSDSEAWLIINHRPCGGFNSRLWHMKYRIVKEPNGNYYPERKRFFRWVRFPTGKLIGGEVLVHNFDRFTDAKRFLAKEKPPKPKREIFPYE